MDRLVMYPPAVTYQRQWDRLIGYALVHADSWHLLFNMITLWSFGTAAEQAFTSFSAKNGPTVFLAVYVSAVVVSILPSYFRHRRDATYVSLGASGGVSAVLAYAVMLEPAGTVLVFAIPMPGWLYLMLFVVVSAWLARRPQARINHQAHLVGTGYGLLLALLLGSLSI